MSDYTIPPGEVESMCAQLSADYAHYDIVQNELFLNISETDESNTPKTWGALGGVHTPVHEASELRLRPDGGAVICKGGVYSYYWSFVQYIAGAGCAAYIKMELKHYRGGSLLTSYQAYEAMGNTDTFTFTDEITFYAEPGDVVVPYICSVATGNNLMDPTPSNPTQWVLGRGPASTLTEYIGIVRLAGGDALYSEEITTPGEVIAVDYWGDYMDEFPTTIREFRGLPLDHTHRSFTLGPPIATNNVPLRFKGFYMCSVSMGLRGKASDFGTATLRLSLESTPYSNGLSGSSVACGPQSYLTPSAAAGVVRYAKTIGVCPFGDDSDYVSMYATGEGRATRGYADRYTGSTGHTAKFHDDNPPSREYDGPRLRQCYLLLAPLDIGAGDIIL